MQYINNDTLLMLVWTLRHEENLSPDMILTLNHATEELMERKNTIPQWLYIHTLINNDLSYLTDINWCIVRALTRPMFNNEVLQ